MTTEVAIATSMSISSVSVGKVVEDGFRLVVKRGLRDIPMKLNDFLSRENIPFLPSFLPKMMISSASFRFDHDVFALAPLDIDLSAVYRFPLSGEGESLGLLAYFATRNIEIKSGSMLVCQC